MAFVISQISLIFRNTPKKERLESVKKLFSIRSICTPAEEVLGKVDNGHLEYIGNHLHTPPS